ncbi:MAG: aldo/keto reductase [Phycisphaerales bacterium]|nr:aldo/keto reductase [Phycisphaerae bacterium]NNF41443.1 aldo/keto reductase [Phycisphaerales bacterium]NNM26614.1 aldo/keto reductase [Phycisphaerales bacterium]
MPESTTQLDHYRLLGRSGLRVSPLCLGTMTFGTDWGWGADRDTSRAIFDAYAEAGGNFIDTANFYTKGTSEKLVGEFVGRERDRFVIATKYTLNMRPGDPNAGGNHRKNMVRAVEASLERLGTDFIDLYWLHMWDSTTPVDEVMRGLDDLVRAGKVVYIGVSDTAAWKVAQANTLAELRGWSRFIALQVSYSLALRDVERDLAPMAIELGLGVTPWAPLAGGILTGKYTRADIPRLEAARTAEGFDPFDSTDRPLTLTEQRLALADVVKQVAAEAGRTPAQVAINWLLTRPGVTSPIIGARTLAQVKDNLAALGFIPSDDMLARLDEASAISLGFPHDFLAGPFVQQLVHGGARVETPGVRVHR